MHCLRNIDSLSYTILSNVDIFHYTIYKKSHLLVAALITSEKSLSVGNLLSLWWQIQFFQNSCFCLETHILSLAVHTVNCFSWSNRFILRTFLPDTQVWITMVGLVHNSVMQGLLLEAVIVLQCAADVLLVSYHFVTQNSEKKSWLKGQNFKKINNVTAFHQGHS